MNAPKRIYLELNNVPPCNFGALWYTEEVPGGVAYRLESDVNEEIRFLNSRIAGLEQTINELYIDRRLNSCAEEPASTENELLTMYSNGRAL